MNTTTLQEEDSNLTPNFQRRSDLINKLKTLQQSDPERFTYRIGNNISIWVITKEKHYLD